MPHITTEKPVVAVALNRRGGDVALRRPLSAGLPVVALAESGVTLPSHVVDRVDARVNHARVGPAIREAVSRGTAWVAVPRTMGTADYLLSSALRSVGKHVDEAHPGIALLVVSPDGNPEVPYRRALTVVDLTGRGSSGMTALAAVEICAHFGTPLDVLVLGVADGPPPGSTQEWQALLPVERRSEMLRRAIAMVDEYGVDVTWQVASSSDPVTAVAHAVATGRYDLTIDSVGGHRLRKRIGKRHDIRKLVNDPADGGVVRNLLQSTTCDVLVVLDAITLGMVPATAVRTGAAAALALGMVGLGTPVAAQSGSSQSPGHSPVVAPVSQSALVMQGPTRPAPAGGNTAKDKKAADEKAADKKAATPATKKKAGSKPGTSREVTSVRVAEAQRKSSDAQTEAQLAEQAVAKAEREMKAAKNEVKQAEEALEQARETASPAAEQLAESRLRMGKAKTAAAHAEQEHAQAKARANALMSVITGGRVHKEADAAAAAATTAEQAARQAQSVEAAAYEEYLEFATEVAAAEAEFIAASDDAALARAQLDELAEKAAAAQKQSKKLAREAKALDEALAEQGLHTPARGRVTSSFGPRVHPVTGVYKQHTGTDFAGTDGKYYAAASGVVTYAGYDGAYGYMVKIDHGRIGGQKLETWYAHQPGLSVNVGQDVGRGEVIGRIGNTGYSTGPHAHVELHVNGQPVDLMAHLAR